MRISIGWSEDRSRTVNPQFAAQVNKILDGAKPGDIPFEQSKIELVINLKTARILDLVIAPALFAQANRVID